jgi:hypothetical protein
MMENLKYHLIGLGLGAAIFVAAGFFLRIAA